MPRAESVTAINNAPAAGLALVFLVASHAISGSAELGTGTFFSRGDSLGGFDQRPGLVLPAIGASLGGLVAGQRFKILNKRLLFVVACLAIRDFFAKAILHAGLH